MSHPGTNHTKKKLAAGEAVPVLGNIECPEFLDLVKGFAVDVNNLQLHAGKTIAAFAGHEHAIAVSAARRLNLGALREKILSYSVAEELTLNLQVPQAEGRLLAYLHQQAEVLEESYIDNEVCLRVRLEKTRADRWQLERFIAN